IEILERIEADRRPADRLIEAYTRARRYMGSRDRAAVRALVFGVLRHRARLDWWCARLDSGQPVGVRSRLLAELVLAQGWDSAAIAEAFAGARYGPSPLAPEESALIAALRGKALDHADQPPAVQAELPDWLAHEARDHRPGDRAPPFDLRVNRRKTNREEVRTLLAGAGIEAAPTPFSPAGLRIAAPVRIEHLPLFRDGLVEIQDEGSQLVALLMDARPGMTVVDYCAGAGGKTLALVDAMADQGRLVACDIDEARLARMAERLARASTSIVETRVLDGALHREADSLEADRVLVDAPCSGSGTWRRHPEAAWRLAPAELERYRREQTAILDRAAALVRPGGRLGYATCSIFESEGEAQVRAFLAAHPQFATLAVGDVWRAVLGDNAPDGVGEAMRLRPDRHGTDGFFLALLERRA
ncbi:MAG: RsmB/NOP family class I SAM-dependent RNA methyltransferase, partial [Alphaproteobacteria bacterium]